MEVPLKASTTAVAQEVTQQAIPWADGAEPVQDVLDLNPDPLDLICLDHCTNFRLAQRFACPHAPCQHE